jgi:acyl carrier protein
VDCVQKLQSIEVEICNWCAEYLANTLNLSKDEIRADVKFARLGLDSANSVFLLVELEEWIGLELASDLLFEHPTIAELARHLAKRCADRNGAAFQPG